MLHQKHVPHTVYAAARIARVSREVGVHRVRFFSRSKYASPTLNIPEIYKQVLRQESPIIHDNILSSVYLLSRQKEAGYGGGEHVLQDQQLDRVTPDLRGRL
jgi:hypothetical protein